ncbi:MAG: large conductance mechanosensitive channel protein MscL [Eubacteriales bacterium]|jgi:large conductance mechanosensitive channel
MKGEAEDHMADGDKKKKGFMAEFREFISRGNVMDLAVGMIIGSAFTAIVNSLVNDVVMPLISLLIGGISFQQWNITMGSGKDAPVLGLGNFIAAVIDFLLIALVIFIIVKAINDLHEVAEEKKGVKEEPAAPTTKICPYCRSEIPVDATRCPHCTSQLEKDA